MNCNIKLGDRYFTFGDTLRSRFTGRVYSVAGLVSDLENSIIVRGQVNNFPIQESCIHFYENVKNAADDYKEWLSEKSEDSRINISIQKLSKGLKNDEGKVDYTLLLEMLHNASHEVSEVLAFGANKYGRDNWENVGSDRYMKAALRHMVDYMNVDKYDEESTRHHLAHAVANLMFIMEKEMK